MTNRDDVGITESFSAGLHIVGREIVGLLFGKQAISGRRFHVVGGAVLSSATHCVFFLTRPPALQNPFWLLLCLFCLGGATIGGVIGFLLMIRDDR